MMSPVGVKDIPRGDMRLLGQGPSPPFWQVTPPPLNRIRSAVSINRLFLIRSRHHLLLSHMELFHYGTQSRGGVLSPNFW